MSRAVRAAPDYRLQAPAGALVLSRSKPASAHRAGSVRYAERTRMRLLLLATFFLVTVACATGSMRTYPSSQLAGPHCQLNLETLKRVTYDEVYSSPSGLISIYAIGCAGCPEVFVEAQHQWIQKHHPGYAKKQYNTAYKPHVDETKGFPSDMIPPNTLEPGSGISCFYLVGPDQRDPFCGTGWWLNGLQVCFFDSGMCREPIRKAQDSHPVQEP